LAVNQEVEKTQLKLHNNSSGFTPSHARSEVVSRADAAMCRDSRDQPQWTSSCILLTELARSHGRQPSLSSLTLESFFLRGALLTVIQWGSQSPNMRVVGETSVFPTLRPSTQFASC